ncbi:phospholipase D-like domain-containing anti-phage protein [Desulfitobacterium sp. THU1]|uniref:phospholipase D-like domain-containing anti-phage protein n=1 Tax=Desulfitobacterium sp. THU1 TaxID=3138072 RepID=UPI00311FAE1E
MINRYSSRRSKLSQAFLNEKLKNAVSYDRIAGYFCSSILEIAGESIENVDGKVRIICNSSLNAEDVETAVYANHRMKQEWCEYLPEEKYSDENSALRLRKLHALLSSGKLEIKVMPDEIYGLMHGKAGVITYGNGNKTSFLGSINETKSAYTVNYEMLWEDDSPEATAWVQEEFDFFWNSRYAVNLCDFVISDIDRISKRVVIPLKDWRDDSDDAVPAVAVEDTVYRRDFGLWEHQKYFVELAFREHKQKGGARFLLADMVGLGKTIQLAMSAKLMALYGDKPVLIIVPKTLTYQWQEELKTLLDMPSAVWTGRGWIDENGYEYPADSNRSILKCPRRVGIISQGMITRKSETAELLKQLKYECVILDEAHRARRTNAAKDPDMHKAQPNNLLAFLNEITFQTKSLLLATATPVQINPIEVFDLLHALSLPNEATKVLGDKHSVWRRRPQTALNYISGNVDVPTLESEVWEIIRNPFPQKSENNRRIEIIRNQLDITDDTFVLPQSMYSELRLAQKQKIKELYFDDSFVQNHNPYIRSIIRRTRKFLEETINKETGEYYLEKIEVELFGENDKEALELMGYLYQAYTTAEEFCSLLSSRVKGGGFMSTLMLRRIGSTMLAGENTAKKMLAWTAEGKERLRDLYEDLFDEDDEDNEERRSEIKELTIEEVRCLEKLVKVLKNNKDTDPKYEKVLDILQNGVEDEGAWKDKGCIIFSQYFDSVKYVAELLSKDLKDTPIALYAGGDKSGIYVNGSFRKETKENIKKAVKNHEIKILVGTDAASEGLNLQTLSTLINLDLPWNPTRLEQRKGRIQRIGQISKKILIYNMRYKDSVEDKVHVKLSERLKSIHDIFGQIPEVLEDIWIAMAQNDEKLAEEAINKVPKRHPFELKYEQNIPKTEDWQSCTFVLNKEEKLKELLKGW